MKPSPVSIFSLSNYFPCEQTSLFLLLKSVGVPTNAAAEGKLFAGGRMLDVQRTFFAFQLYGTRSGGTSGQLRFGYVGDSLQKE